MSSQGSDRTYKHIKHIGPRPSNDEDNPCRAKLCHLVKDVGCFHELFPERLYLVYLAKDEDPELFCADANEDPNCPFIFWAAHEYPNMTYESFNMDFGPFNLATTHQFCSQLKVWLDTLPFRYHDKHIVVVLGDRSTEKKLNATLLVAIAAMVLLNLTDQEVIQRLNFFMMYKSPPNEASKQLIFREKKKFNDVSGNQSLMTLTLEDCIKAFYAALQLRFYDYYEFDHTEYLFYETVMSGDLNWIVPGKILAFAGPSDKTMQSKLYHKHPPKFYHNYFRDHNVTTIIRLNEPEYDSAGFTDHGFEHHDLIFPDGYPPTSPIAARFIKLVDEAKGAVAVHCYAGIGRTGTLIAAYLMARYDFTTQMAIAWTRICRPGSVIGEQQDWLLTKFDRCSIKSNFKHNRGKKNKSSSDTPVKEARVTADEIPQTPYAEAEKTYGQAKALLLTKKQRGNSDRPCTRGSAMLRTPTEGETLSKSNLDSKKSDIVLDLGKTVPLMLNLADLLKQKDTNENAVTYRIEDNKYEWKVKFPKPGYVALKHNVEKDLKAMELNKDTSGENIFREPILEFRYESEDLDDGTAKSFEDQDREEIMSRLKPAAYYHLFPWYEPCEVVQLEVE